jgi:hypothetical protein
MAKVTNTTSGGRQLPDGTLIPAGETVDADMGDFKGHPVVDAWLDSGELKVGAAAAKAAAKADEDEDEPKKPAPAPMSKPEPRKA